MRRDESLAEEEIGSQSERQTSRTVPTPTPRSRSSVESSTGGHSTVRGGQPVRGRGGLVDLVSENPLLRSALLHPLGSLQTLGAIDAWNQGHQETPRAQLPPRQTRIRFADSHQEGGELLHATFLSKLSLLHYNIAEGNSVAARHIGQPVQENQVLLSQTIRNLHGKLESLTQEHQYMVPSSSVPSLALKEEETSLRSAKSSMVFLSLLLLRLNQPTTSTHDPRPTTSTQNPNSGGSPFLLPPLQSGAPPQQHLDHTHASRSPNAATHSTNLSCVQGRAHIKPVELPKFNGNVKDFWEFKKIFSTLVEDVYLEPALYIMQLKNHLKPEAQEMIKGVTEVQRAWSILGQYYGDKSAAIVTTTSKLCNFKTKGSAAHEKLESLAQVVQQAITSLKQLGAESVLASDYSIIGCLVSKLSPSHMERWDDEVPWLEVR